MAPDVCRSWPGRGRRCGRSIPTQPGAAGPQADGRAVARTCSATRRRSTIANRIAGHRRRHQRLSRLRVPIRFAARRQRRGVASAARCCSKNSTTGSTRSSPWLTIGKRIGDATSTDSTATGIVLQAERARLLVPTSWGDAADDGQAGDRTRASPSSCPAFPSRTKPTCSRPWDCRRSSRSASPAGCGSSLDRNADGLDADDRRPGRDRRLPAAHRARRPAGRTIAVRPGDDPLAIARRHSPADSSGSASAPRAGSGNRVPPTRAPQRELLAAARNFEAAYQQSSTAADRFSRRRSQSTPQDVAAGPEFNSIPFAPTPARSSRQAEFEKSLASLRGGENQLAGGDFEDLDQLRHLGWQHVEDPIAGIQTKVQLSGRAPQEGRYCLELSARRRAGRRARRRSSPGRSSGSRRRRFARRPAK